jgi:hypothetical protein
MSFTPVARLFVNRVVAGSASAARERPQARGERGDYVELEPRCGVTSTLTDYADLSVQTPPPWDTSARHGARSLARFGGSYVRDGPLPLAGVAKKKPRSGG